MAFTVSESGDKVIFRYYEEFSKHEMQYQISREVEERIRKNFVDFMKQEISPIISAEFKKYIKTPRKKLK